MRLLGSTTEDVEKDKNGENVPKLESVEVVLVHCSLVKNDYQHTLKVLFTFVAKKQFGQLIDTAPHSLRMLNTTQTEFSFVEVWFTDQNCAPFKKRKSIILLLMKQILSILQYLYVI